jgi:hypothetical protein
MGVILLGKRRRRKLSFCCSEAELVGERSQAGTRSSGCCWRRITTTIITYRYF